MIGGRSIRILIICWGMLLVSEVLSQDLALRLVHQRDTQRDFSGIDDFQVQRYQTQFVTPLVQRRSRPGWWQFGAEFEEDRFFLSGSVNGVRRFYRFSLPMVYEPKAHGRWHYVWHLEPAYYADESLFEQTRLKFEFAYSAHYQATRRAAWVLGLRRDSRFGQERLYPVVGLESRPNRKIHHHWVFPQIFSSFKVNRKLDLEAFIKPDGGRWTFLQEDGAISSFGMSDWDVGLAFIARSRLSFNWRLELGYKVLGEGSVSGAKGALSSGFFYGFGIQAPFSGASSRR